MAGLPRSLRAADHKRGNLSQRRRIWWAQTLFAETISIDKLGFGKVRKAHPELTRDVWANLYRAAIGTDDMKLIQTIDYDTKEVVDVELYDLAVDPFEEHDLAGGRADRVKELEGELEALYEVLPVWEAGEVDEAAEQREGQPEMSREQCEQLIQLGYFEGECEKFDIEF